MSLGDGLFRVNVPGMVPCWGGGDGPVMSLTGTNVVSAAAVTSGWIFREEEEEKEEGLGGSGGERE